MQCPIDGTALMMSERQGVEIDYCPTCRGVWLDRGELDKIIERAAGPLSAPASGVAAGPRRQGRDGADDDDRQGGDRQGGDRHGGPGHRRRRRDSFLSDIFDF